MPAQLSDFISINRGGTPGNAGSGTYYLLTLADMQAAMAANATAFLSTAAGNDLGVHASDGKIYFAETETTLVPDTVNNTITFTNEAGAATVIDMSTVTTDIYVNGATLNATSNVLTLTDNDGGTANVTVNLGKYVTTANHNATTGVTTVVTGTGAGSSTMNRPAANWMAYAVAP